jgi:DNA-binding transcriptional LysR family regulator
MTAPVRPDKLNWNLLKAFLGIARYRSLADAARAAGVQRPTVSQKISELEVSLGFPLMERQSGGDGFTLTPRGRQLRCIVADFHRQLAALHNAATDASPSGEVANNILRDVEEAQAALQRAEKALRQM